VASVYHRRDQRIADPEARSAELGDINSRDQTGWGGGRDEEERIEDEIRLSAKVGKERGEKAKKDANPKAEEQPPRAMIHDDVDNTASITFDETKVEAKIEQQSPLLLFMPNLNPLWTAKS
jgi:hypothetical protein